MDSVIRDLMSAQRPAIAIANLGLKKMEESKDKEDAKLAGDCFLKAITDKGEDGEKRIASLSLAATKVNGLSTECALAIQRIALTSISSGVSSPPGVVIAGIGAESMRAAGFFWYPQAEAVGGVFLKGIAEEGQDSEKDLANQALLFSQDVDCRAGASMGYTAMELMSKSLQAPASQLVAKTGISGMGELCGHGSPYAAKLGEKILASVEAVGTPREKALASMTKGMAGNKRIDVASLARFQSILLSSIGSGISSPFSTALMKIGGQLIDEKRGVDYYSRVFYGSLVTKALAEHTKGNLGIVADTTSRAAAATGGMIGAEIERTLFESLNGSLTGPVEKDLIKFCGEVCSTAAWKASCHCGLSENKSAYLNTIKGIFLEAIRDNAEDRSNRRVAGEAIDATTPRGFLASLFSSIPVEKSLKIRDEAFQKILYREQAKGLEREIEQEIKRTESFRDGIPGRDGEGSAASEIERFDDFVDIKGLKLPVSPRS